MINVQIKILLKVLANRLKFKTSKVISEDQFAFIQGRNINESIIVVNEVLHSVKNQEDEIVIFKVDFSKAYDSINWKCLVHIVRCLNLGERWCRWIEQILLTSKISILVNESPSQEFSPLRGIRQGDPLAPYLFLLIGEVLNRIVKKAQDLDIIRGFKPKFVDEYINIIQCADDVIFFSWNNPQYLYGLKKYSYCFKL